MVDHGALRAGDTEARLRVGRLFGPAFAAAAPLVLWLAFAAMAILFLGVASAILVAGDHAWDPVVVTTPLVLASLAGFAVAIPRFGALGAASVTTAVACLAALGAAVAVHRRLNVAPPIATVWWSVVASALAFTASRWISERTVPVVAAGALALLAAAVPIFFLATGELSRRELMRLSVPRS